MKCLTDLIVDELVPIGTRFQLNTNSTVRVVTKTTKIVGNIWYGSCIVERNGQLSVVTSARIDRMNIL